MEKKSLVLRFFILFDRIKKKYFMIQNIISKTRTREKREKVKKPIQQEKVEEHHRKPSSIGGTNQPGNLSAVLGSRHRDWHTLFGNLDAPLIFEKLKEDILKFGFSFSLDLDFCIVKISVEPKNGNFSKNQSKRKKAWERLFKDMYLAEIIREINDIWLDPDYILVLKGNEASQKTIELARIAA